MSPPKPINEKPGKIPFLQDFKKNAETLLNKLKENLANVVGLGNLKNEINAFAKGVIMEKIRESRGGKKSNNIKHMLFSGNPGTGKTTVGRLMAEILYDLGITKRNVLVEVQRPDLVGQHIGQTGPKTRQVLDRAYDAVLFIDEAYRLHVADSKADYGREALETIMENMEEGNPIVILAGYPREMGQLLDINAGLKRRINHRFHFPDYSSAELAAIFQKKALGEGFILNVETEAIVTIFDNIPIETRSKMNASLAGRLLSETRSAMDERLCCISENSCSISDSMEQLFAISQNDLNKAEARLRDI